jgi:hypothetical protein
MIWQSQRASALLTLPLATRLLKSLTTPCTGVLPEQGQLESGAAWLLPQTMSLRCWKELVLWTCRWHWEMAQLNSVVRTLIRFVYGTSLASGSFTEALECYRKAAELNPTRLVHKWVLAVLRMSVPSVSC